MSDDEKSSWLSVSADILDKHETKPMTEADLLRGFEIMKNEKPRYTLTSFLSWYLSLYKEDPDE